MKTHNFYVYKNGNVKGYSSYGDYFEVKNRAKQFGKVCMSYEQFINDKRNHIAIDVVGCAPEAYLAYLEEL